MNPKIIFLSIFLLAFSNVTMAQPPSNQEFDQLIQQQNAQALKYFNEYLNAQKTNTDKEILVEKLCRSQEAVNDVIYNAIQHPTAKNADTYLTKSKELNYLMDQELDDLGATPQSCYRYMFNK